MQKYPAICILAILFLFASGCEVCVSTPFYQHAITETCSPLKDISEEEIISRSANYPTPAEENEYVGEKMEVINLNETQKQAVLNLTNKILPGLYRMSFVVDSTDYYINDAYSVMTPALATQLTSTGLYESMFYAAKFNNIDIDIETVELSNSIVLYQNISVGEIIRVFCSLKIAVNSNSSEALLQTFPQYSLGNMNRIELYLYLVPNSEQSFSLYAYREVTINPLVVSWYTPTGIVRHCLNPVKLYTIENNPSALYRNVEYAYEEQINTDIHRIIENTMVDFSEIVFNTDSHNKNGISHVALPSLARQYIKYTDQSQALSHTSHLISYKYNRFDTLNVFRDESGFYYEVFMIVGYESQSQGDNTFLTFGDVKIPVGSYSGVIRALVTASGDCKVYDWTLLSVAYKSPGVKIT